MALAISLGQHRARCSDQGSGDDQQHVAEHVAAGRNRQAGERVEQRDDDRHVGAADWQHEQHSRDRRQHEQHDQQPGCRGDDQPDRQHQCSGRHQRGDVLATGMMTGRVVIHSCSFRKVTMEPEKDTEPMITVKTVADENRPLDSLVPVVEELDDRDQRRSAATDTVEQRHHLRHLRHLDPAGRRLTDQDTDDD